MKEKYSLNYWACKYCEDIFELFDEIEIMEQLTPIRDAWEVGREVSALKAEQQTQKRPPKGP